MQRIAALNSDMSVVPPIAVLDIEGTVCPISFVHDKLFPYALQRAKAEIPHLKFPLTENKDSELAEYLADFPAEYTTSADSLISHIEDLVKNDVKAGYLKALQGYLWKSGYESGEIQAPVFSDVPSAIKKHAETSKVYIYSSGSVPAQLLLFKHTDAGDLTSQLSGYFDTKNAGPKMESDSYDIIRKDIGVPAHDLRFFSDNPKEIDAAHAAGWKTTFVVRPGNPEFPDYKPPGEYATELNHF